MSTQVNTYVMHGVLLPHYNHLASDADEKYELIEPYLDSAFSPDVNLKDGLTVLAIAGQEGYIAIGHVIAKSANHCAFNVAVKLTNTPKYNFGVLLDLVEKLGFDRHTVNPGWIVISHYR